jgi:2-amino-4-hydroxy-6-hydroxymethyldihydropteridine diphosphokinase
MSQPWRRGFWRPAYVAVGSNLQSPRERVLEAFERLSGLPATLALLRSRLYLSRPLGPQDQPDYVNAAIGLLTTLAAHELLDGLLGIERGMGRERHTRWGPRVIDLDLLWMPDAPIEAPGLTVPHPGVSRVLDLLQDAGSAGITVLE